MEENQGKEFETTELKEHDTGNNAADGSVAISQKESRKIITGIGIRYAIFGAVVTGFEFLAAFLLQKFAPGFVEQHSGLMSCILVIAAVDVIGFTLIFLLTRKLPKGEVGNEKLSAGRFILGILFMSGICGAGSIIGIIIHTVVTMLLGGDPSANNALLNVMLNTNPFIRILTVGILAPIFEELIFRKFMIDRLSKYGKWVAILLSGLTFGLFHGNFSQVFFATGIGILFAYVYMKTGKIQYTILYHMCLNLTTSVITVFLSIKYMDAIADVDPNALVAGTATIAPDAALAVMAYLLWLGFLLLICSAGVILLIINLRKFKLNLSESEPRFGTALKMVLTNPGFWAFAAVCLFLFVNTYFLKA